MRAYELEHPAALPVRKSGVAPEKGAAASVRTVGAGIRAVLRRHRVAETRLHETSRAFRFSTTAVRLETEPPASVQ